MKAKFDMVFSTVACLVLSASVSFAVLFLRNCFSVEWPWYVIIGGWLLVLIVQVLETMYSLIRSLFSWRRYWKRFLADALFTLILIAPFYAIGIYIMGMMGL